MQKVARKSRAIIENQLRLLEDGFWERLATTFCECRAGIEAGKPICAYLESQIAALKGIVQERRQILPMAKPAQLTRRPLMRFGEKLNTRRH